MGFSFFMKNYITEDACWNFYYSCSVLSIFFYEQSFNV